MAWGLFFVRAKHFENILNILLLAVKCFAPTLPINTKWSYLSAYGVIHELHLHWNNIIGNFRKISGG